MKKNELKITVSGHCNTGKSRITYLIKEYLREKGFEVEFDGNIEHQTENIFDSIVGPKINDAVNTLNKKTKISIKEVQLNRDFKE